MLLSQSTSSYVDRLCIHSRRRLQRQAECRLEPAVLALRYTARSSGGVLRGARPVATARSV